MPHNMRTADRVVRTLLIAPAAVIAGVLLGPAGVLSLVLYAVAAVMVATSAIGFCPLYVLMGGSRCPLAKPHEATR